MWSLLQSERNFPKQERARRIQIQKEARKIHKSNYMKAYNARKKAEKAKVTAAPKAKGKAAPKAPPKAKQGTMKAVPKAGLNPRPVRPVRAWARCGHSRAFSRWNEPARLVRGWDRSFRTRAKPATDRVGSKRIVRLA